MITTDSYQQRRLAAIIRLAGLLQLLRQPGRDPIAQEAEAAGMFRIDQPNHAYVLIPLPDSPCPDCKAARFLLCNDDYNAAAFYLCPACGKIEQIGVGRVTVLEQH